MAIAALTLAACGSGAADNSTPTAGGSTAVGNGAEDVAGDAAGGAAGIVESGSGEQDPELVGVSDGKRRPAEELVTGRIYEVVSATGITFVDPASVFFSFSTDGQISLIGGCNTQFGALEWDGEFVKAPVLASTMMACEQPLMDQDAALSKLFEAGFATDVKDATLTLTGADATIVLAEQAIPGVPETVPGSADLQTPAVDGPPAPSGD